MSLDGFWVTPSPSVGQPDRFFTVFFLPLPFPFFKDLDLHGGVLFFSCPSLEVAGLKFKTGKNIKISPSSALVKIPKYKVKTYPITR